MYVFVRLDSCGTRGGFYCSAFELANMQWLGLRGFYMVLFCLGLAADEHKSSSVEDLNMKNLRQSQDNLHTIMASHAGNVTGPRGDCCTSSRRETDHSIRRTTCDTEQPHKDTIIQVVKQKSVKTRVKHMPSSDYEKDVAEPSIQKLVEDRELEHSDNCYQHDPSIYQHDAAVYEHDTSVYQHGACVMENSQHQLFVHTDNDQNDQSENYKEFSQLSPKNNATRNGPLAVTRRRVMTSPRDVNISSQRSPSAMAAESEKERKLLDYESEGYSKFDSERRENEKSKRSLTVGLRSKPSNDLDEMYRLPTEHLCYDRDYSNERIKHKRLSKAQKQYLVKYREEINELNERLKEASLDGAVGGVDEPHDVLDARNVHSNQQRAALKLSPGSSVGLEAAATNRLSPQVNRRQGIELANHQRMAVAASMERRRSTTDGFSSPEDIPSSPRASFCSTAGARPKKSPRKQKAL